LQLTELKSERIFLSKKVRRFEGRAKHSA
jgi:hypothetical protein